MSKQGCHFQPFSQDEQKKKNDLALYPLSSYIIAILGNDILELHKKRQFIRSCYNIVGFHF